MLNDQNNKNTPIVKLMNATLTKREANFNIPGKIKITEIRRDMVINPCCVQPHAKYTEYRTHCGNELINAVGCHAVEMCEVKLQVDLVVEHVLAQWAT